ncbi:hypothetical protein HKD37_05G013270 [Glycine soja]
MYFGMGSFFHGLFPSGWHLSSSLLLCLPLHLHGGKSPLKDLIEAQRSILHRSSTSKLPSSGIRAQELQVEVMSSYKTSSIKCFKCLERGHITSQCPTKKTMIMRGQDIYSSQDEATTSPSSSESEEANGEESRKPLMVKEECVGSSGLGIIKKEGCTLYFYHKGCTLQCVRTKNSQAVSPLNLCKGETKDISGGEGKNQKNSQAGEERHKRIQAEVSVSSKRLVKKESHFEIKTNIKETSPLRQPPHLLLCKKTLVSTATPLGLEVIPQVNELLDEGLVCKSLNLCALLVPKIGADMRHLRFVVFLCRNNQHENTEKGVEGRSPKYEEPRDLRSNPFQGGRDDAIIPSPRVLDRRLQEDWARAAKEGPRVHMNLRHPLQDFYPRHILGGETPSSLTYSLVDGASPLLFSFAFHCISMVENHH